MTLVTDVGEPYELVLKQSGPNSVAVPTDLDQDLRVGRYFRITPQDPGEARKETIIAGPGVIQAICERGLVGKVVTIQEVDLN